MVMGKSKSKKRGAAKWIRIVAGTTILFTLSIPSALAATGDVSYDLGSVLYRIMGWLFVDFSDSAGSLLYEFYLKFALFVLVFALYFFAATKAFKGDEHKSIRITIAFVFALLSVALIPHPILASIAEGYKLVGTVVFFLIPAIGFILLNHYAFSVKARAYYGVKAIVYYVIAMLFHNMSAAGASFAFNFQQLSSFAEVIFIFLAIANLFMALTSGDGVEGEEEGAGKYDGSSPIWKALGGHEDGHDDKKVKHAEKEDGGHEDEAKKRKREEAAEDLKTLEGIRERIRSEFNHLVTALDETENDARERLKRLAERIRELDAIQRRINALSQQQA